MTKEEVRKRLQATKAEDAGQEYAEGKAAGREWAERLATAKELLRLRQHINQAHVLGECYWKSGRVEASNRIVEAIRPIHAFVPETFWEEALGDNEKERIGDEDFLHGFVDGAIEIWAEHADEL